VFEVSLGLPGIFGCGVSFPGHQVLPSDLYPAVGQALVHFELLFSTDKVTRGVRIVQAIGQ
jgi:hypothetical protein